VKNGNFFFRISAIDCPSSIDISMLLLETELVTCALTVKETALRLPQRCGLCHGMWQGATV
jgi:hypothetical protein